MSRIAGEEVAREAGIPDDVLARAFRANNGELGWRLQDAILVAELLGPAEVAILGGEVWLVGTVRGEPRWHGILPLADGGEATFTWNTEPDGRQEGETWSEFCARGARQAVQALRALKPELQIAPELRPRVRYNLCYLDRQEYEGPIGC